MDNLGKNYFSKEKIIILILILLVVGGLIYFWLKAPINLNSVEEVVEYLGSFGYLSPALSFLVLMVQAFFPVIPFFLLVSANGILYGVFSGLVISLGGALTGASISFFVARGLGRDWALRRCEAAFCREIALLSGKKGFGLIILARILPVIPAALVNLLAGVSSMGFCSFLTASAIGKLPAILFYTIAGGNIVQIFKHPQIAGLAAAVIIILYLFRKTKATLD